MDSYFIPRLIIRADASTKIGAGHLVRCLSLAQAWIAAGGSVDLITYCSNAALLKQYQALSIKIVALAEDEVLQTGWLADYSAVKAWVALDGYHFDRTYQQEIHRSGLKVLLIDDYNHFDTYVADVILNQNFSAEEYFYNTETEATYLLGTAYTLLRNDIKAIEASSTASTDLSKHVVIAIGASDPDNVTGQLLKSLSTLMERIRISVVAGALNPHVEILKAVINESPHAVALHIDLDAKPLFSLIHNADVAIVSGGGTARESAHLATPLLTVQVAENQHGNIQWLTLAGVAHNLGVWPLENMDAVPEKLAALLVDQETIDWVKTIGPRVIPASGAQRVVQYLLALSNDLVQPGLFIRAATADDSLLYWVWSNQSHVRQYSLTSELIPLRGHINWYTNSLASETRKMWVLVKNDIPVGQVRYDKISPSMAQIGISVATTQRGHGYAVYLINETVALARQLLGISVVEAVVKNDNGASLKLFQRAGFEISEYRDISTMPCTIFQRYLD